MKFKTLKKKLEEKWGEDITTVLKETKDMSDVEFFFHMIGGVSLFEIASEKNRSKCVILVRAFMERMGYTEEQFEACRDKEVERNKSCLQP